MFSLKDQSIRAELIWAMNVVSHSWSAASSDNITPVLNAMFKGLPDDFSIARTKLTYYWAEALAPYFRDQLLCDLQTDGVFYSIEFDESDSNAGMKELQVSVR